VRRLRSPPPLRCVASLRPRRWCARICRLRSSTVWFRSCRRLAKVTLAGGALRELHEGDAIGPLVVSEIEPSGVVFVRDGVELRRRVGAKN
jgi:hypothetical protein